MASTRTDVGGTPPEAPAPLDDARLGRVPGVLGRIARERSDDYRGRETPTSSAWPPAVGAFREALRRPGLSVIAEIKRASPSQGPIADLDPAEAARALAAGGADALSVLTEARHFGGDLAHIDAVRGAVGLPILRKDFVVHPLQVHEAAARGAAAVLLIVAVLGEALGAYLLYARALGLDALVEVHDEDELALASLAGADIVGVNNRDLRTLEIDLATAPRLISVGRASGHDALWVAESGYATAADVGPLREVADAILVGTALARRGDLAAAVRELAGRDLAPRDD